jgi:hypothetical protein
MGLGCHKMPLACSQAESGGFLAANEEGGGAASWHACRQPIPNFGFNTRHGMPYNAAEGFPTNLPPGPRDMIGMPERGSG